MDGVRLSDAACRLREGWQCTGSKFEPFPAAALYIKALTAMKIVKKAGAEAPANSSLQGNCPGQILAKGTRFVLDSS